jgi:hypothetical protein
MWLIFYQMFAISQQAVSASSIQNSALAEEKFSK